MKLALQFQINLSIKILKLKILELQTYLWHSFTFCFICEISKWTLLVTITS